MLYARACPRLQEGNEATAFGLWPTGTFIASVGKGYSSALLLRVLRECPKLLRVGQMKADTA